MRGSSTRKLCGKASRPAIEHCPVDDYARTTQDRERKSGVASSQPTKRVQVRASHTGSGHITRILFPATKPASSASFPSSKERRGLVLDSRIFANGMS